MPTKPKTNQPETPEDAQVRDCMQTPNYAVDLLIPYIPSEVRTIWDACAGENGDGKITKRLRNLGYNTYGTDIRGNTHIWNFIT